MMIAAIAVGAIVFLIGYLKLQQNKKIGGPTRLFALVAYAGMALAVVVTMQMVEPMLMFLAPETRSLVVLGTDIAIFMIGAELLIKPEFDRKEEKNNLSEYRDKQNSYRPKNKKKKK